MIIWNHVSLRQSRAKLGRLACLMMLAGASGCSSFSSSSESITGVGPVGYQSDREVPKTRGLEVPPDLTQLQKDNRYSLPANQGAARASEYMEQQQKSLPVTVAAPLQQDLNMRIERQGNQRWLVVEQAPENLWPEIKRFWKEAGFTLETDLPQAGILETDWAENRAKIGDDFIRRSLGKVLDAFYSTGERDKFRTRLERNTSGGTEIYITHRGLEEVLVGSDNERTRWTSRPSDPELEAEFLARLMVFLGADKEQARQAAAGGATKIQERARLIKDGTQSYVELNEGFDRAWRRVGLALDRSGFTVEDRNRADGVYFVRYVDQDDEAQQSGKGFFSGWFSSKAEKKTMQYRITVKGNEVRSQVGVLTGEGVPDTSSSGERILILLQEQLK